MKTIIITGGYGQLGESCNKYLKQDFNIIITGREAYKSCLLYTSPSPRDRQKSRMPSSA